MGFWNWLIGRTNGRVQQDHAPIVAIDATPDAPIAFGRKTGWLAVRCIDPMDVARILEAENAHPCNWMSGLANRKPHNSGGTWVFITPPLDGWVLVNIELLLAPDHDQGVKTMTHWLNRLSAEFQDAQYFGSYRVAGFVSWMHSRNGTLLRGFSFVGGGDGVLLNTGAVSSAEADLGYDLFDGLSPERANAQLAEQVEDDIEEDDQEPIFSEDDPLIIAQAWSVSPDSFAAGLGPSVGVIAEIAIPET